MVRKALIGYSPSCLTRVGWVIPLILWFITVGEPVREFYFDCSHMP